MYYIMNMGNANNIGELLELSVEDVLDGNVFTDGEHNFFNEERIGDYEFKKSAVDQHFIDVLQKYLDVDLVVSLTDLPLTFQGQLGQRNSQVGVVESK